MRWKFVIDKGVVSARPLGDKRRRGGSDWLEMAGRASPPPPGAGARCGQRFWMSGLSSWTLSGPGDGGSGRCLAGDSSSSHLAGSDRTCTFLYVSNPTAYPVHIYLTLKGDDGGLHI